MKRLYQSLVWCCALLTAGASQGVLSGSGWGTMTVQAADAVAYLDENGDARTTESYTLVNRQTTWNSGTYVVSGTKTISSPVRVTGNVVLILTDDSSLEVIGGIDVRKGSRLTILAQSSGSHRGILTADASESTDHAGIGSGQSHSDAGTIVIGGGEIIAKGGYCAAGIGGSAFGSGGTITITGGTVTAVPGMYGAAVGGGYYGSGGVITVSGGRVIADAGKTSKGESNVGAAGIGGGKGGGSGKITISGGILTAHPASSEFLTVGADSIGNSAIANFLEIPSHVTVTGGKINYQGVSYLVVIPDEVTVGETLTVSAEQVILPEEQELTIRLECEDTDQGAFLLRTSTGTLRYTLQNSQGQSVQNHDTVLTVSAAEETASATLTTALAQTPEYAGTYQGNLTFRIEV